MRNHITDYNYLTKEKIKLLATECKKPRLTEETMMAELKSRLKKTRAEKLKQIKT